MQNRFEPEHNRLLVAFAVIISFIAILLLSFSICNAQTKYVLKADANILIASELIAKTQVGIEEKKGNKGGNVEDYLRSVGIYKPAPYCMAGQYWCFWIASKLTSIQNPIKKTAGAIDQYNFFKARGKRSAYVPAVNDFVFWQKSNSWAGHVERIIEVGEKGWVTTIGFNTGSDDRDGEGVYIRKRHILNPLSMLLIKGLGGYEFK